MSDDIDDIKGYLDDVGDFNGVTRSEAPLQRENVRFIRIYKSVWLGEIRANVLIDIKLPPDSKTSLIICDMIVYEGKARYLIFPRSGIPLPSGSCYIVLKTKHPPQIINCAVQKLSAFSIAGSTIEWGGYHINMFGKRFQITNDMRLIQVRAEKDQKRSDHNQFKKNILMTTGSFLKDYFWANE